MTQKDAEGAQQTSVSLDGGPTQSYGRLVLNVVSAYGNLIVNTLLLFTLTPFIIQTLGIEAYGMWSLVWAALALMSLLNLGFGASVSKFVAEARGRADTKDYQTSVASLFWIHVGEMLVLLVLIGICAQFSHKIFDVPGEQHARLGKVFLILGVAFAVQVPLSVFHGILGGHQRWAPVNGCDALAYILYFIATLVFLPQNPSIITLATVYAVTITFGFLLKAVYALRELPVLRHSLAPRHVTVGRLRKIWVLSAYFAIIAVGEFITARVDVLIIQWFLDLRSIALYAVAARVAHKVAAFGSQLAHTLTPTIAEYHGRQDREGICRVWFQGSKFSLAIAGPPILGLALMAEPLLVAWLGEDFRPAALLLQLLLAAVLLECVHWVSHGLLSQCGEERALAVGVTGTQLLNFVATVLLISRFGLVAAAGATLAASVVGEMGYIMHRVTKQQGVSRTRFYAKTVLPNLLPLGCMAMVILGGMRLRPGTNLFELAFFGLLGFTVYWLMFWKMGMVEDEHEFVRERVRGLRARFKASEG